MSTNVHPAKAETESGQGKRDLVVSHIVRMGSACAPDLAGQMGHGLRADDLIPVLESLVEAGVLQHKKDHRDQREYGKPYQVVYELAK